MGSEYFPAPTAPTRIVLPDGSKLSGDVSLNPGNNVGITKQGNGGLVFANPPGPRRPLSVFAPGAITARTLQKATIPAAVLQQLDVFLLGAPVGVTGASCGNVVIAGSVSGSAVLPLSSALTEWHLGPTDLAIALGSARIPSPASHANSVGGNPMGAYLFTPTADLLVFNIDVGYPVGCVTPGTPGNVRYGIAQGVAAGGGHIPTLADPSGGVVGGGWVLGVDGYSQGFADVDSTIINGGGTGNVRNLVTLPGTEGFLLHQGTTYAFIQAHTDPAKSVNMASGVPFQWNPTVTGSVTVSGAGGLINNGMGNQWATFGGISPGDFSLYGGIVGLTITGLCVVSTSLTGTPATPGSDVEIYAQF